jgi:hypothetical protein
MNDWVWGNRSLPPFISNIETLMEGSGRQRDEPISAPEKVPAVHEYEAGCSADPVWTLWKKKDGIRKHLH